MEIARRLVESRARILSDGARTNVLIASDSLPSERAGNEQTTRIYGRTARKVAVRPATLPTRAQHVRLVIAVDAVVEVVTDGRLIDTSAVAAAERGLRT